jgi:hypothetical protein
MVILLIPSGGAIDAGYPAADPAGRPSRRFEGQAIPRRFPILEKDRTRKERRS